jgi:hypothetical protein
MLATLLAQNAHAFHRQYLTSNHHLQFLYEQHNTHDAFKSITTYVLLLLKSRPYLSPAAGQIDLQRLGLGAVHFHQQKQVTKTVCMLAGFQVTLND